MPSRFAALPMYDPPELSDANDALWEAIAERLTTGGLRDVPTRLTRGGDLAALWRRDGLLLGQTCGYPLMTQLSGQVQLVATPVYDAEGCDGPFHRSAVVVARTSPIRRLEDLRGARCVLNDRTSNTGMNLLRALVAPVSEQGRFFGRVTVSGSHRESLALIAEGAADVAAIDCVTLALQPLTESVRVLAWTAPSPGLPFITGPGTDPATLELLRTALDEVLAAPALSPVRDALLIRGVRRLPLAAYDEILRLELIAAEQGYAEVA